MLLVYLEIAFMRKALYREQMSLIYQKRLNKQSVAVGWREWCALPSLGVPLIKAKIDTGARTSAIHAFDITPFKRGGKSWVKFYLHPIQGNNSIIVGCVAEVIDQRSIMSSNGQKEHRYVIQTALQFAEQQWNIELTLSNRDPLRFRILLGRAALQGRTIIDPAHSYLVQKSSVREQIKRYSGIVNVKKHK